jgi:hypothetical protein
MTARKSHSIREMDDTHLPCRTLGHRWLAGPITQTGHGVDAVWHMVLDCGCGVKRVDEIDQISFEVVKREYKYPDGYQVSFFTDRAGFRAEFVQRKIKKAR